MLAVTVGAFAMNDTFIGIVVHKMELTFIHSSALLGLF